MEERIEAYLSETVAMVLRLRCGLGDDIPQTRERVGEAFRVSRERIRKIEGSAIRKLRRRSPEEIDAIEGKQTETANGSPKRRVRA